ncbi:hypothetical protein HAX54_009013 [Datura stramonium]|uniref:Uncharacterized protein n=1 Tax=Datura stramonium TaxID=4076 RepID=A0ABS8TEA3_DATST|nr:hypothetical protein [Datura stramonium]
MGRMITELQCASCKETNNKNNGRQLHPGRLANKKAIKQTGISLTASESIRPQHGIIITRWGEQDRGRWAMAGAGDEMHRGTPYQHVDIKHYHYSKHNKYISSVQQNIFHQIREHDKRGSARKKRGEVE